MRPCGNCNRAHFLTAIEVILHNNFIERKKKTSGVVTESGAQNVILQTLNYVTLVDKCRFVDTCFLQMPTNKVKFQDGDFSFYIT